MLKEGPHCQATWPHPWHSSEKCRGSDLQALKDQGCVFPVHQASSWMNEPWWVLVTTALRYFVTFGEAVTAFSSQPWGKGDTIQRTKEANSCLLSLREETGEQIGPRVLRTGKSPQGRKESLASGGSFRRGLLTPKAPGKVWQTLETSAF